MAGRCVGHQVPTGQLLISAPCLCPREPLLTHLDLEGLSVKFLTLPWHPTWLDAQIFRDISP